MERAFCRGVNIECIENIPTIKHYVAIHNLQDTIYQLSKNSRKKYLSSINLKLKNKYAKNYRQEQQLKSEGQIALYKEKVLQNLKTIQLDLQTVGFPGERIIGLDDKVINKGRNYCELSSEVALITLYHFPCSYSTLKEDLLEEVLNGNLHPKDFAYIFEYEGELSRTQHNRFSNICTPIPKNEVLVLIDWDSPKNPALFEQANTQRLTFMVPPIEHDIAKKEYAQSNKMRLFFGFGMGYFRGHR